MIIVLNKAEFKIVDLVIRKAMKGR